MHALMLLTVLATADADWGPAKNGLATRLTLVTEQPMVGKPIALKLEVKNVGNKETSYDDQQASVNGSLDVKGPDGAAVAYIGGSFQTMGKLKHLKPGVSTVVFGDLDLAAQYLIEKPGEYTVTTRTRTGLPVSNALKITVKAGELPDRMKLFVGLHKVAPKDWRPCFYGKDAIVFLNTPTNLKANATSVELYFTKSEKDGRDKAEYLGETKLGHAWMKAQDAKASERWPDYGKVIREQLSLVKK